MRYYRSLTRLLQERLAMHKARLKFIARFTLALLMQATVSFPKLALVLSGSAKPASNYRRIQRFMADFGLDLDSFGRFLLSMVPKESGYVVSMDRTCWKFGRSDINVLMIAICYKGIAYPIVWRLLPKAGNSNTAERKALMRRFLSLVPASEIRAFLADREFVGTGWIGFLCDEGIPFYIRVKKSAEVTLVSGDYGPAWWFFRKVPVSTPAGGRMRILPASCTIFRRQGFHLVGTRYLGRENEPEYLLVLTNAKAEEALALYRRRWEIETLFGALKSRGFDLEATHLRDPERIEKLLAILSLAFIWAHLVGLWRHEHEKELTLKRHGRLEKSYFRYGLDRLQRLLLLGQGRRAAFERCLSLLRDPQQVLSCT